MLSYTDILLILLGIKPPHARPPNAVIVSEIAAKRKTPDSPNIIELDGEGNIVDPEEQSHVKQRCLLETSKVSNDTLLDQFMA